MITSIVCLALIVGSASPRALSIRDDPPKASGSLLEG